MVPLHERESGFYSRYFIVPKKDEGLHPFLDLRQLNRSVSRLKFKMLKQVVSQIRSEDWFVTIDLKDAYFHISILPTHRDFLRFAFGGEAYQYRVLPFGLALSPRTFTKCVDATLAPLRLQGIRILIYIKDWLILAQSEQMAAQHRDVVLTHMKVLGLRLNAKKSVLSPALRTTYLGVVWDSTTMQARMSPAWIESILTAVARVRGGQSLTVKRVQRPLGLMAPASNVIPLGLLYMRPLQGWLKTRGVFLGGNPLRMIKVTWRCLCALDMWRQPWFLSQGLSLSLHNASDGRVPHRLGSRHPVEAGAEARGMDASPQGGEADLESVWPGTGGPLRYSGDSAMSPLVLSNSIASSPLFSPLGDQDSLLRSWPSGCRPRPSCAPFTLARDLSVWRRGYLILKASPDAARVPEEERLRLRM